MQNNPPPISNLSQKFDNLKKSASVTDDLTTNKDTKPARVNKKKSARKKQKNLSGIQGGIQQEESVVPFTDAQRTQQLLQNHIRNARQEGVRKGLEEGHRIGLTESVTREREESFQRGMSVATNHHALTEKEL